MKGLNNMTTISNYQSASQATSYLEKDNYYIKDGITEIGQYGGELSKEFGLNGNVDMKDFYLLANGIQPNDLKNKEEVVSTLKQIDKLENELKTDFNNLAKNVLDKNKDKLQELYNDKLEQYNQLREEFNEFLGNSKLVRDTKDNETGIIAHTRGGFDLTFSAPKSVSVASLVLDDKRLMEAHKEATSETMDYLEKSFAQTRVYENGERIHETTSNLSYASFTHYTSRAVDSNMPDPQLHTHNFIFNMTKSNDGVIRSLDNIEIARAVKLAGQIYQNSLASKVQELGYNIQWGKTGDNYTFELKGINDVILDNYSKRTEQIDIAIVEKEQELGRKLTDEEKSIINLETRVSKSIMDIESLKSSWDEQLNTLGYNQQQLKEEINTQQSNKLLYDDKKTILEHAIKNLENTKSTYTQHELLHESLKLSQGQFSKDEFLSQIKENTKPIDKLENETDINKLGNSVFNNKTEVYSSKKVIEAENRIFTHINNGKNIGSIIDKTSYSKIMQSQVYNLTNGQKNASTHIATSQDRIIGIQGDAGVGKTTMLLQLNKALNNKVEFIGLAPTGKAASEIEHVTGIKSQTVDSFLLKESTFVKEEKELSQLDNFKQKVYLVDEASMMDTFKIDKLLQKAINENARVVFIGDTKQLKAVGAGDMFSKMQEKGLSTAKMEESLRQKTDMTQEVVKNFKNQNIENAFSILEKNNKIFVAPVNEDNTKDLTTLQNQFVSSAVEKYTFKGLDSTLALVTTNEEKKLFNNLIREQLVSNGKIDTNSKIVIDTLSSQNFTQIDKQFASNYRIGDTIILSKHNGDMKANRQMLVVDVNSENNQVKVEYESIVKTMSGTQKEISTKWVEATKLSESNIFYKEEQEFAIGDKIVFEKNDKSINVKNGEFGTIKNIDEGGNMTIDKNGELLSVNSKEYNYINHAYVITTHKSQGQSIDNVLIWGDSKKNNLNAGYVQMSRAKQDIEIYTDDKEKLQLKYEQEQIKENASDYKDLSVSIKEEKNSENIKHIDKIELQHNDKQELKTNEILTELKDKIQELTKELSEKIDQIKDYISDKLGLQEKIEKIKDELNLSKEDRDSKNLDENKTDNKSIEFEKEQEKNQENEQTHQKEQSKDIEKEL